MTVCNVTEQMTLLASANMNNTNIKWKQKKWGQLNCINIRLQTKAFLFNSAAIYLGQN